MSPGSYAAGRATGCVRGDRSEAVRLAAAKAMGQSAFGSKRFADALDACVTRSNRAGMPAEYSQAVIDAARASSEICRRNYLPATVSPPVPPPEAVKPEPDRVVPRPPNQPEGAGPEPAPLPAQAVNASQET